MSFPTSTSASQEQEQELETASPPISADAIEAEKVPGRDASSGKIPELKNIENTDVEDDPREWDPKLKWAIVAVLSFGALIPTLNASIFFPAIADLKRDLNTSDQLVSLSVSLYILFQGGFPLLWSPLSEVWGRKKTFILSNALFVISMVIASVAPNMPVLIVFRVIAAMGSAANLSIAAGSIADMYVPSERGQVIGIYYSVPTVGPALAPIFGGALTETRSGWRASFYFVAAAGFVAFILYCFIKEPFRTERSLAWQAARSRALKKAEARERRIGSEAHSELTLEKGQAKQDPAKQDPGFHHHSSTSVTKESPRSSSVDRSSAPFIAPSYHSPGVDTLHHVASVEEVVSNNLQSAPRLVHASTNPEGRQLQAMKECTTSMSRIQPVISRKSSAGGRRLNNVVTRGGEEISFKPGMMDVNPLASASAVLKQPHNLVALLFSSLVFASQYSLSYTASRTFAAPPYNYSPIYVGLVLLSLGAGGVAGSVVGGRNSDARLRNKALKTGQPAEPEERIKSISVWVAMALVPPAFACYGWTAYFKTSIAGPVISLLLLGTCQFYLYSPALSYLVDSNKGRSSGAVACNSCSRGLLAFVASEVAGPIQDKVKDGALYTGWAVLLILAEIALVIVSVKGRDWRDPEWKWPRAGQIFDKDRENGSRWIRKKRERKLQDEKKKAVG